VPSLPHHCLARPWLAPGVRGPALVRVWTRPPVGASDASCPYVASRGSCASGPVVSSRVGACRVVVCAGLWMGPGGCERAQGCYSPLDNQQFGVLGSTTSCASSLFVPKSQMLGRRFPRLSSDELLPTSTASPSGKRWLPWSSDDISEDEVCSPRDVYDNRTLAPRPLEERSQNKPLPPPPKPPPVAALVTLSKPYGVSLGIRFFSDPGEHGAEIQKVDEHGLAWRAGLGWGDAIQRVRVRSTTRQSDEASSEHVLRDGYDAAKALRPASGLVELEVVRRKQTAKDRAAARVQGRIRGMIARATLRHVRGATTTIASAWRRAVAVDEAERRRHVRDAPKRAAAALLIQTHFRRFSAWIVYYEQSLALVFVQQQVRAWLERRRAMRTSRKRRRAPASPTASPARTGPIRAPARLVDDEDDM
jgi:hypothetical protein